MHFQNISSNEWMTYFACSLSSYFIHWLPSVSSWKCPLLRVLGPIFQVWLKSLNSVLSQYVLPLSCRSPCSAIQRVLLCIHLKKITRTWAFKWSYYRSFFILFSCMMNLHHKCNLENVCIITYVSTFWSHNKRLSIALVSHTFSHWQPR